MLIKLTEWTVRVCFAVTEWTGFGKRVASKSSTNYSTVGYYFPTLG